ncbi:MAG: hypothetical protein WCJ30_03460 [Deltaproteobacteria bacterium]
MTLPTSSAPAQRAEVRMPMHCSRGPAEQTFRAVLTLPGTTTPGATFTVRIDSFPSGRVEHFGLYNLFDMRTDYAVAGGRVVPSSPRIVAGTGTPNVRVTARAWLDGAVVHALLPARIDNGQSYTPPSIEFDVAVDAPAGGAVRIQFVHYEVGAVVFLLGRIRTNCDPAPSPATVATVRVDAPASAPRMP